MKPELRKRLIDSIEYLRKMGFFADYSGLSSEEILERIFSGEIDYRYRWREEEQRHMGQRRSPTPRGVIFKESIKEHEEDFMKESDAMIDYELAFFDDKRFFVEDWKIHPSNGMGITLIKKLARISRGVFSPTDIREEWKIDEQLAWCRTFFKFRGKEHYVDFTNDWKLLVMDPAVSKINELIRDTGYQYYTTSYFEDINYVVLTEEEAEKLKKERGWKLKKV